MPDIKQINPVSEWITLTLDTDKMDPPVLRVRVRLGTELDSGDAYEEGARKASTFLLAQALAVIVEWDLTLDDKPLLCTEATKREHKDRLWWILAQKITGTDPKSPKFAATEILAAAKDSERFLKNSPTTST
jgi:hypothetical protein